MIEYRAGKLTLTRDKLQKTVVVTATLLTQLESILTTKASHFLFPMLREQSY